MRSAIAAAVADWYSEGSPDSYSRYYDAAKGIMTDTIPTGYGKSSKDSSTFASVLNASGIPNTGVPRYVVVNLNGAGIVSLSWGGNAAYLSAVSPYKNQTLVDLKSMPNADRIKADQEILKAIAKEILSKGWKLNDLKSNLVTYEAGGYRIADYYQLKTGLFADDSYRSDGVRFTCKSYFQEILKAVGYSGSIVGNPSDPSHVKDGEAMKSGTKDMVYDDSLFYCDALATNKYKNYSENLQRRIIYITGVKTNSSGVITEFTINAKAHGEANMDPQDKNYFIITVSSDS